MGLLILLTCLVPAIASRETAVVSFAPPVTLRVALQGTLRNRPFLYMLGMNFFAITGMYATVTVTLLLSIYFLFQGDQDAAATLTGVVGMAQMLGSLAGVPVNTAISVRVGKRGAALFSLAVGAAGFASPGAHSIAGPSLLGGWVLFPRGVGHAGRLVDVGDDERGPL